LEFIDTLSNLPPAYYWLAFFSTFLGLLIMGLTNRVVIFYDLDDFLISLSPPGSLIVTIGFILYFGEGTHAAEISAIVGTIFLLIAIIAIFVSSIRHNGLLIGLVVGSFKLIASLLIVTLAVSLIERFMNPASRMSRLSYVLLFGLLGWVLYRMINGEKVMQRRLALGTG